MLTLSERVKETTHRTLPGLNALNWQCQAHWFLTWGVGGGGLAVPPAVWARGKTTESVEQGSGFWGEHGSHCPGPASTLPPPHPSRPLVSPFWALGSQTQDIKPQLPFEPRSSEFYFSFIIFGKALLPPHFFTIRPAGQGTPLKPSSHSLYRVTLWLKPFVPKRALDSYRPLPILAQLHQ